MNVLFSEIAWDQYQQWQDVDKKKVKRINQLIKDIQRNGYTGIGKPEPLRYLPGGYWSRRIDAEHRLVYKIENNNVIINQCATHYGDH